MIRLRKALGVTLAVAGVASLGGCGLIEPSYAIGPATIQRSGDSIVVAICTNVVSTGLVVDVRRTGFMSKWVTVLEASGNVRLARDNLLDVSGMGEEWTIQSSKDFDIDDFNEVDVGIRGDDPAYFTFSAGFSIPESGLSTTEWLHTDGTLTKQPCEGEH